MCGLWSYLHRQRHPRRNRESRRRHLHSRHAQFAVSWSALPGLPHPLCLLHPRCSPVSCKTVRYHHLRLLPGPGPHPAATLADHGRLPVAKLHICGIPVISGVGAPSHGHAHSRCRVNQVQRTMISMILRYAAVRVTQQVSLHIYLGSSNAYVVVETLSRRWFQAC